MRKVILELIVLLGIGGLIWAAFALFVKFPAKPSLVSRETEAEIGIKVRESVIRTNGFDLIFVQEADQILQEIAERIAESDTSAAGLSIEIIRHDMVNAFALPGGHILVTTGLIDFCENAEEFVSVVCHEAAHVINRDALNRIVSSMGLELLLSNDPFVSGEVAKTLISTGYSRSQEKSADIFSCTIMSKLGLEPRALASFLRRLKDEKPGQSDNYNFEIIATHPDLDSRIREVLLFLPPEGFVKSEPWFEWDEFKQSVK
jgi:beta-barrel assembly-enhancing protease